MIFHPANFLQLSLSFSNQCTFSCKTLLFSNLIKSVYNIFANHYKLNGSETGLLGLAHQSLGLLSTEAGGNMASIGPLSTHVEILDLTLLNSEKIVDHLFDPSNSFFVTKEFSQSKNCEQPTGLPSNLQALLFPPNLLHIIHWRTVLADLDFPSLISQNHQVKNLSFSKIQNGIL
jgi:hypothetical protein